MNFKTIRITILLLILGYIGIDTVLNNQRSTNWKRSLRVVVYPINADDSEAAEDYISQLQSTEFEDINTYLEVEAKKYNPTITDPIRINLAPQLRSKPPALSRSRSTLAIIWWSIKLRFWAWKNDNYTGPKAQIKAYALYYDPSSQKKLQHSTGLQKAKIAMNHLFASNKQSEQNNIVLLHEILHTLGATDKYNLLSGSVHYPDGYADSQQRPLYPQKKAEIMGGRIALSKTLAKMPESLKKVVVGPKTASEIGWVD